MIKRTLKLISLMTLLGLSLWSFYATGLAQSLNNQVEIMRVGLAPEGPNLNEVYLSVLGPYPDHFFIGDLGQAAFAVYENDAPMTVSEVTAPEVGLAVVILMDRSGSMREGGIQKPDLRIDSARQAARDLIDQLKPETDLVGLIGFHDQIGPALPLTSDNGAARNMLYDETAMSAEEGRNTALYNSTYQALDWLIDNPDPATKTRLEQMRKIILIFTDGRNTEPGFSAENVRDRALQYHIPIYTVGVDTGDWDSQVLAELQAQFEDADWLARSTDARFLRLGSPDERSQLLQFFAGLVSQRSQYRLTYPTQASGNSKLRVVVTTADAGGTARVAESNEVEFSGHLKYPAVKIVAPADNFTLDLSAPVSSTIPIALEVSFPDNIERPLKKIEYYASGTLLGATDTPPYAFTWDAADMAGGEYTLIARVYDSVLTTPQSDVSDNQVTVKIIVPPPLVVAVPLTLSERIIGWLGNNWLSLLLVPVVLVLSILLLSTRRQLARGVRSVVAGATTGVLKSITRPLGASRATAKLVIIRGSNPGREFKIDAQVVKVGRDPQFCDFALTDQFSSNPHFTIMRGPVPDYYIQDENSSNGTHLNGQLLPRQQQVRLPFDSVIRVGDTELTFKQIGGPTRLLPRPTQKVPPYS